jgi:serine protease Do
MIRMRAAAIVVGLMMAVPATAQERPVSYAKVVTRIPVGTPYATLRAGPLCLPAGQMVWNPDKRNDDPKQFEPIFRRILQENGIALAGDPDNLFRQRADIGDFSVGGAITNVNVQACLTRVTADVMSSTAKGSVSMSIEWQIYSNHARKVVAKIATNGVGTSQAATAGGVQQMTNEAYAANVRSLIRNPAFRSAISLDHSAPSPSASEKLRITNGGAGSKSLSQVARSTVLILTGTGHGSGFLISADGYLLTNAHVVDGDKALTLRWSDGSESTARVLRVDVERDVALLKVDPGGRPPLALSRSSPDLGQPVFAVGTPLDRGLQGTVTRGIVSAQNRMVDKLPFLQSDVTVNPGNSGGPLVTEDGRVVAITVLGFQPEGLPTGINLFIPIADALKTLNIEVQ